MKQGVARGIEQTSARSTVVSFPDFLAIGRDLPAWLVELAGFELEEWEAPRRARSPEDDHPDRGPFRACSTLVLRPYRYDFVRWIDDLDRAGEPAARACTCVFWQDRAAESFRNVLEAAELAALADPGRADRRLLEALREADLVLGAR